MPARARWPGAARNRRARRRRRLRGRRRSRTGGRSRRRCRKRRALYKGDLLPDCAGEWIDADRERLRQRARERAGAPRGAPRAGARVRRCDRSRAAAAAARPARRAGLVRADALSRAPRRSRDGAARLSAVRGAAEEESSAFSRAPPTRLTYREVLDLDAEAPAVRRRRARAVYPLVGRSAGVADAAERLAGTAAGRRQPRLVLDPRRSRHRQDHGSPRNWSTGARSTASAR